MKFKAVVSERGLRCLTKGFAPMLEKFGRTVQVLLGPEAVHLVQDKGNTDGAHLTARISKAVLFERGTLTIGSKHRDLIAFSMDLQMLVRVLRAAMEMGAESLEVKLAVRHVQVDTEGTVESRPFLSFAGRGVALNLDMDMPISQPYLPAEVERLREASEHDSSAAYYVSLQQELPRVHAVLEKLKSLRDRLDVGTTEAGDLHLYMRDETAHVGTELRGLAVVWPDQEANRQEAEAAEAATSEDSAAARLASALRLGTGHRVTVLTRHFSKVLQCCQIAQTQHILCGIAQGGWCLHFAFVFQDLASGGVSDDTSLSVKLPVMQAQN